MNWLSWRQNVRKSATSASVASWTRNAPPPSVPFDPMKRAQSPAAIGAACDTSRDQQHGGHKSDAAKNLVHDLTHGKEQDRRVYRGFALLDR